MGLTTELAAYAADAARAPAGERAFAIARMGIMDAMACALGGAHEDVSRIALAFAGRRAREGEALVQLPWADRPLPASQAAFALGVATHALDYDDVALAGHPSTALAPAVLAQGHAQGASGRDCLDAYVAGYEVWAELFVRERDPLHVKGWHPTAVYGTVGATAALARLRRLDAATAARALAIAASLAGGLVANFGTMTKPLHAGRAASLAFEAVELAELGLTAAPDAIEHHAGLLHAISLAGRVDRESPAGIGRACRLETCGLSIKKYPVCYSGHRIIDAVADLAGEHGFGPDEVERVDVGLGRSQASMLRNRRPATALEAKFSLEFAVAAALVDHDVGFAQLTDGYVNRPDLRALYERVHAHIVEEPDDEDPTFSRYDEVEIALRDGRRLRSGPVQYARGHARLPLDGERLAAKFRDCLARYEATRGDAPAAALPGAQALIDRFTGLDRIPDVRGLLQA